MYTELKVKVVNELILFRDAMHSEKVSCDWY